MYQRLQREECFRHRLEHPIMHHQKFGKIDPTIPRVIFGASVVSFMKCVL